MGRDRTAEAFQVDLERWRHGESEGRSAVVESVYEELRGLAKAYMRRERPDHTLQSTALVHEALLRLLRSPQDFNDRTHFFRAAATAMRRILVDHARKVSAGTRIPPRARFSLEDVTAPVELPRLDLLDLDAALSKLGELDPELAEVVELRCFVGLTIPEVAQLRGVSPATISREWKHAKAWLHRSLGEKAEGA